MTIDDLITEIESQAFDAELNIFSGFQTFYSALQSDERVEALANWLVEHPQDIDRVIGQFTHCAKHPTDENTYDAALAAYLLVLQRTATGTGWFVSDEIIQQTSHLWWARRLARQLQTEQNQESLG
jgi:hypothetical protein